MPPTLWSLLTQCYPPAPQFTDKDVADLTSKVYIVTGATSGVGKELARILYAKNAKVYIAAREEKDTISKIEQLEPSSNGSLEFLKLDLADLRSVKAAAESFLVAETQLNVLFNNAGIMTNDGKNGVVNQSAQGYEEQLAVNALGPFLFTKLLTPLLQATAAKKSTWTNEVRVIFISSFGAEMYHEKRVGIDMENLDYHHPKAPMERYAIKQGILLRLQMALMHYPPVKGAYTQLYAAFSPDITQENAGTYVFPFGRMGEICKELHDAAEPDGGVDLARKFWEWSEKQVEKFA